MKTITGSETNIKSPVLCKLLAPYPNAEGMAKAIILDDFEKNSREFFILNSGRNKTNKISDPFFRLSDENIVLDVDDIVLFEPNGRGTVLIEASCTSNALMITEKCNCECIMCPQPPQQCEEEDYLDLSLKIISNLSPKTKTIAITGGEPTILWNGLLKILKACRKYLPDTSIALLTNARVFKDYRKVEELAQIAGENLIVCIPIYADFPLLHDEHVSRKGAFWETVEGIYNLHRAGKPVEIRNVITKLNYSRLESWSEFVYKIFPFAANIAIMGLEPTGLALQNIDKLWVDPLDYSIFLEKAVKNLIRRDMPTSIYNHQLCTLPRTLWFYSKKAISRWKNIFIKECLNCRIRQDCGGFFYSNKNIMSRGIKAVQLE